MSEPAEIAKKLTKAQRRVLVSLPRAYGRWWAPIGWLLQRELIVEGEARPPVGKSYDRSVWHPSPLGLAVRRHLLENGNG